MRSLTRLSVCTLLGLLSLVPIVYPATGTPMAAIKHQFFDVNGDPCDSCRLFFYQSGTSTKQTAYSDAGLSSSLSNPYTLDSSGRVSGSGDIFFTPGLVWKIVLAPAGTDDPPNSPLWTVDGVQTVPAGGTSADADATATAGESISAGDAVYWSDGSGGTTAGRVYKTDADNTYSSNLAQATGFATAAISLGSSGTVRRMGRVTGLSGLVAGTTYWASATAGGLTSTKPTNARVLGIADSTTTLIVVPQDPDASSTLSGSVSTGTQTLAGAKTLSSVVTLTGGATYASTSSILDYVFARQTADLTKNANVTPANLVGLAFAVGANQTWTWQCTLFGTSPTAADWRFTFTGPAAATAIWFGSMTANDPASTPGAASGFTQEVQASSTSGNELILLRGIIRNGANAGTIQAQMAQATSTAGNSTIFLDSYCEARRTQ